MRVDISDKRLQERVGLHVRKDDSHLCKDLREGICCQAQMLIVQELQVGQHYFVQNPFGLFLRQCVNYLSDCLFYKLHNFFVARIRKILLLVLLLIEGLQVMRIRKRFELIKALRIVKFAVCQEVVLIKDFKELLNVNLLGSLRIAHR